MSFVYLLCVYLSLSLSLSLDLFLFASHGQNSHCECSFLQFESDQMLCKSDQSENCGKCLDDELTYYLNLVNNYVDN